MCPINIDEVYRIIAELMSDYAYVFRVEPDGEMTLEWVTPSFYEVVGHGRDEVGPRDWWDGLIHTDDRDVTLRRRNTVLSGHDDVGEFRIVTKSGDIHWLRAGCHGHLPVDAPSPKAYDRPALEARAPHQGSTMLTVG